MDSTKSARPLTLTECIVIMIVLQSMRIGTEQLIALCFPSFSGKMLTMFAMLLLWLLCIGYIKLRRIEIPFFPKRFSKLYIIVTAVAAALLISAPSNFIGGFTAISESFYGCIVTPVFEETVFRGYFWERLKPNFKKELSVWFWTSGMFMIWHLGYMLAQLAAGNWVAVLSKLAAGLIYGLIIGFVRLKFKNVYIGILVHAVMNLFMI